MENAADKDRVQKIISNAGFCSRRAAEDMIAAGRVQVNGKTIKLGDQAGPEDKILIDGKRLHRDRKVYIVFNKPTGCVTAVTDAKMKTIMDYVRVKERVFPVGRLDYNTSGLLILTNDGDFANSIMHPRYEVRKTYLATLDGPINDSKQARMLKGLDIDGRMAKVDALRVIRPDTLEISLHEGRNRIVRRMFEELGHRVMSLKRTRIGKLRIGDLQPGEYLRLKGKPEI